jgi:hypothetical protein
VTKKKGYFANDDDDDDDSFGYFNLYLTGRENILSECC